MLASCFVVMFATLSAYGTMIPMPDPETRRALLISADCFLDERIPKLSVKTGDDVDMFRERLCDPRMGFLDENIVVLKGEDATLDNINETLDKFLNSCESNDVVIYFIGHGLYDSETNVDYYLPSDAKTIEEDGQVVGIDGSTCFSFNTLREKLGSTTARFKLVISDVSRDNFEVHNLEKSNVVKGKPEEVKDVLWFNSCNIGGVSPFVLTSIDNQPVHGSLFTWFLCKGLEGEAADRQGEIYPMGLFQYVSDQMEEFGKKNNFRQTPVFSCQEYADGYFVLGAGFKKTEKNTRTFYVKALEFYSEGNFKQARVKIDEALKQDPNNRKYQKLKKTIRNATIQEHITQSLKYFASRQYSDALVEANVALALDPANKEALELKEKIETMQ